jgi:hypothetical protein
MDDAIVMQLLLQSMLKLLNTVCEKYLSASTLVYYSIARAS